ncbi:hypothetical protein [Bacillus sp. UNC41MFS5]|uniref:hypothetical protein n=1 Tax=Bacillus sp. UNC41MFS5 TaxID=1449046 RepID=UPI003FA42A54
MYKAGKIFLFAKSPVAPNKTNVIDSIINPPCSYSDFSHFLASDFRCKLFIYYSNNNICHSYK